jgi:hypothetical protein
MRRTLPVGAAAIPPKEEEEVRKPAVQRERFRRPEGCVPAASIGLAPKPVGRQETSAARRAVRAVLLSVPAAPVAQGAPLRLGEETVSAAEGRVGGSEVRAVAKPVWPEEAAEPELSVTPLAAAAFLAAATE